MKIDQCFQRRNFKITQFYTYIAKGQRQITPVGSPGEVGGGGGGGWEVKILIVTERFYYFNHIP